MDYENKVMLNSFLLTFPFLLSTIYYQRDFQTYYFVTCNLFFNPLISR